VKRRTVLTVLLLLAATAAPKLPALEEGILPQGLYVGINLLSPLSFVDSTFTKEVLPYAHGLESGFSVSIGYYIDQWQVEGRLVLGSPSDLVFCPQLHLGGRYFPFAEMDCGFLQSTAFGAFFRLWDFYYLHSKLHFFNISFQPSFGYVVYGDPYFLDVRTNWDCALLTWSSLANSQPRLAVSGFPPVMSFNLGSEF
jgi:hypothetical protein